MLLKGKLNVTADYSTWAGRFGDDQREEDDDSHEQRLQQQARRNKQEIPSWAILGFKKVPPFTELWPVLPKRLGNGASGLLAGLRHITCAYIQWLWCKALFII